MFSDVPLDVTSLLLRYHSPVAVGIFQDHCVVCIICAGQANNKNISCQPERKYFLEAYSL